MPPPIGQYNDENMAVPKYPHFTTIAMGAIIAGTLLMAFSILVPIIGGSMESAKDVLPFVTGLLGFLGGLATAVYGVEKGEGNSTNKVSSESGAFF